MRTQRANRDQAARRESQTRRQRHRPARPRLLTADLHPMVAVKLWENPCWLSFRANFVAHHFNHPVYAMIERTYGLTMPEHVVLYAIGLKDGISADEVAASSAKPKNTLSRAVGSLIAKRLIFRTESREDRRRRGLHLTRTGRRIVDETVPLLVAHEEAMLAALTPAEQATLEALLTKLVLSKSQWPSTVPEKETSP